MFSLKFPPVDDAKSNAHDIIRKSSLFLYNRCWLIIVLTTCESIFQWLHSHACNMVPKQQLRVGQLYPWGSYATHKCTGLAECPFLEMTIAKGPIFLFPSLCKQIRIHVAHTFPLTSLEIIPRCRQFDNIHILFILSFAFFFTTINVFVCL